MEAHAQAVEDNLIDSLQFKLRPGASYVTNRRSVTFHSMGGNDYKPGGVRVIKINMTSDQWLDPSTVKLFFTVQNTNSSYALRTKIPGPWVFFRRCRVLIGGQICEDIDNYNRVHQMFHILKPGERRINDNIEGFGSASEATQTLDRTDLTKANTVAANGFITVGFTPMVGLFNQNKYLPIRYCPIQLELEVVSTATDAVFGTIVTAPTTPEVDSGTDFILQDIQLKCDLVDLDDTLDNEYTAYLMEGSNLPIHYTALTAGSQIITNYKTDIHVSRSLTRLKAVFVTLYKSPVTRVREDGECNVFYHPMGEGTTPFSADLVNFDFSKELSLQIQVGSKLYPEYPINSSSEMFYQLRKTLGLHFGVNSVNTNRNFYLSRDFIMAIDMEKVLGASFSGMNTMSGDLLTIRMKPASGNTIAMAANTVATFSLHYTLVYDSIVSLGLTGVSVLE